MNHNTTTFYKNKLKITGDIYKILARPVLNYGSKAWTILILDEQCLKSIEISFLRRILDHIQSTWQLIPTCKNSGMFQSTTTSRKKISWKTLQILKGDRSKSLGLLFERMMLIDDITDV